MFLSGSKVCYLFCVVKCCKPLQVTANLSHLSPTNTDRKQAVSHQEASQAATSKDLGTKLGFLFGNTGVLAVNAVIASDLGDTVSAKAGGSGLFSFCLY